MLYEDRACTRVELNNEIAATVHQHAPRRAWYLPVKMAAEWLAALLLLVLTMPLIAVMALAAKLSSPGPAFYGQVRCGRDGKAYRMYKIRSMTHNCEAATGAVWSTGSDQRVTRIGRFLRDTHLDELPQLWNVLRGEMSLIGSRPERPELVVGLERALPRYRERMIVRPGLTGLAQVQRPADAELEDVRHKLAYDIYYVREVNPWMDLRIAVCTTLQMVGLCLGAAGKLLVKPEGAAAERDLESVELIDTGGRQVGVA